MFGGVSSPSHSYTIWSLLLIEWTLQHFSYCQTQLTPESVKNLQHDHYAMLRKVKVKCPWIVWYRYTYIERVIECRHAWFLEELCITRDLHVFWLLRFFWTCRACCMYHACHEYSKPSGHAWRLNKAKPIQTKNASWDVRLWSANQCGPSCNMNASPDTAWKIFQDQPRFWRSLEWKADIL